MAAVGLLLRLFFAIFSFFDQNHHTRVVNTHKYIHNDHKTYPNRIKSDLGLLPKTRWWAQNWACAYHQNRLSQNRPPAVLGVFSGFNTLKIRQNRPKYSQNDPKTPKNHIETHFGSFEKNRFWTDFRVQNINFCDCLRTVLKPS